MEGPGKEFNKLVDELQEVSKERDNLFLKLKKNDILIFDQDYLDIPLQDMKSGNIIVCHDPQKRLGKTTWGVMIHHEGDPKAKGLFWDKDQAILFAENM